MSARKWWSVLRPLARVAAAIPLAAVPGCRVPPEGESTQVRAVVRYEIEVAEGFTSSEVQGMGTFCNTPEFEWIFNKRLDAQGNPTAFDERGGAIAVTAGRPTANGRCVLATGVWEWVAPGQFRVVATDYQWIAKCNATLIALSTSGSFHNVRFVRGSDGCQVTVEQLPPP
jgi:hypothetical protein